jgi:spermidine synthase
MPQRTYFGGIAVLYLLSGGLGLLYEVAFSKYLSFVFGATAYASSAVLVAFMGGLSLGAHLSGKLGRRFARPLWLYGCVELAIGGFCLVAPSLFGIVTAAYVSLAAHVEQLALLSAARYLLASLIVFIPAAGMGATLPLLARFVRGSDGSTSQKRLTALYAINTVGGSIGSLLSAYWIIPSLGLSASMRISAVLSMLVGAIACAVGQRVAVDDAAKSPVGGAPSDLPSGETTVSSDELTAAAASGFLVFASEVIFVHMLALVIGTSVYAFGLMLAIFLVCLAAGTPLANLLARLAKNAALPLSLAIAAIALAASLPIWDKLPDLFARVGARIVDWPGREAIRGLAAFGALAIPVTCMGTTFPLVIRSIANKSTVGADVGRVTVANTIGSIAGSIVGGFVVLPRLGSQRSLVLVACAYAAMSLWLMRSLPRAKQIALGGLAVAAIIAGWALPAWNMFDLTSGANVYFERQDSSPSTFVMVHEDIHGGVTTVGRNGAVLSLWTNGKFQGNDADEGGAQRGFAHLPSIFAPRFGRALVVGMGTGTTVGTMAAYPYQRVDVAELAPAIVEAARTHFAHVNHRALYDPRVHVMLEDGRNVLLVGSEKYDVITVELSSIWFAGAANLYNREFYKIAKRRLSEDGVLQQWVQLHHTTQREIAGILATLRLEFPYLAFFVTEHQGHVVASQRPLVTSTAHLTELEQDPRVRASLGPDESLMGFARGILFDDQSLDQLMHDAGVSLDQIVSTDDNLYLEYETPRNNVPSADMTGDSMTKLGRYETPGLLERHVRP